MTRLNLVRGLTRSWFRRKDSNLDSSFQRAASCLIGRHLSECGLRESNSYNQFGKLTRYHYTKPALVPLVRIELTINELKVRCLNRLASVAYGISTSALVCYSSSPPRVCLFGFWCPPFMAWNFTADPTRRSDREAYFFHRLLRFAVPALPPMLQVWSVVPSLRLEPARLWLLLLLMQHLGEMEGNRTPKHLFHKQAATPVSLSSHLGALRGNRTHLKRIKNPLPLQSAWSACSAAGYSLTPCKPVVWVFRGALSPAAKALSSRSTIQFSTCAAAETRTLLSRRRELYRLSRFPNRQRRRINFPSADDQIRTGPSCLASTYSTE